MAHVYPVADTEGRPNLHAVSDIHALAYAHSVADTHRIETSSQGKVLEVRGFTPSVRHRRRLTPRWAVEYSAFIVKGAFSSYGGVRQVLSRHKPAM